MCRYRYITLTLFVNFVIANNYCYYYWHNCSHLIFFMSCTGDWTLNPLVWGTHSLMATSFACSSRCRQNLNSLPRMLTNQMRAVPRITSCTRELRAVPGNYVHVYSSDRLASAVLTIFFITLSRLYYQEQSTK